MTPAGKPKQLDLLVSIERTGPAQDDEADYPYRFMSPALKALTRADAERREQQNSEASNA